jgi:hypothetical protein
VPAFGEARCQRLSDALVIFYEENRCHEGKLHRLGERTGLMSLASRWFSLRLTHEVVE